MYNKTGTKFKRSRNFILLTLMIILNLDTIQSQVISFDKTSYKVGDEIKATIIGNLQGIENGFTKSSVVANEGVVSLGIASTEGSYYVKFNFANNITKTYLFFISSGGVEKSFYLLSPKNLNTAHKAQTNTFITELKKMTMEEHLTVMKEASSTYFVNNSVGVTVNVVICVSVISGQVYLTPICSNLSKDHAAGLFKEILKGYLDDLVKKGVMDAATATIMNSVLSFNVSNIKDIASQKKMKDITSFLLETAQYQVMNENIKIGVDLQSSMFNTFKIILKK